jgi:hypothetical protein
VDSLLFSASIKTETCVVDGQTLAAGISVVSRNALLCGGSGEISYDGFIYCKFSVASKLELVEVYFNGIEFHQLVSLITFEYLSFFSNRSGFFFVSPDDLLFSHK